LADVTIARCYRPSGAGSDNVNIEDFDIDMSTTYITRSHMGHLLNPGDYVKGYHLHSTNFNSELYDELLRLTQSSTGYHEIPDVVLVRKVYPGRRQRNRKRHWKVKRLTDMDVDEDVKRQMNKRGEQERKELEWEGFLRDLEEDKDLRGMVNLYRGM
jgi:nonsense-mediated mRNA decay protein 3